MPVMRDHRSDKHRPHAFSAFTPAAAVVVAGLTLAACGGGEESAGAGSSGATGGGGDRAKVEQAALRHAECMRKQGIDVPDPKPGEGGIILSDPSSGGDPGAHQLAAKKCEKYLRNLPPPKLSDEQKTAMRDGALNHARCMRRHGIAFPDPTFDDNGGITVKIGEGFDPSDPRVRQAEEKCQELLPRPDEEPVG